MHECKIANLPCFLLNYRWGHSQVTQKYAAEMGIVSQKVKQEYLSYVLKKLDSIDAEISAFLKDLSDLKSENRISFSKYIQTIQTMYKNYLSQNKKSHYEQVNSNYSFSE
jgi:hypothetical protein